MNHPRKMKPVGVLTKAFRIIDVVRASSSPLTLNSISVLTKINKSTALRLLSHLETEQYLTRDMRGGYSPGAKLLQAWGKSGNHTRLLDVARRSLWELWQATKESLNLGVLEGSDVVYLDCLESPHDFRLVAHVGTRAAFYRTALGKAMVAFLPKEERRILLKSTRFDPFTPRTITSAGALEEEFEAIRQLGYAMDNEESQIGVRCIAAPILDADRPVAAISISGPASRVTLDSVPELSRALRATVLEISARLLSSDGESESRRLPVSEPPHQTSSSSRTGNVTGERSLAD
jgi:DNA-binding IclR family transcriptional regulator